MKAADDIRQGVAARYTAAVEALTRPENLLPPLPDLPPKSFRALGYRIQLAAGQRER